MFVKNCSQDTLRTTFAVLISLHRFFQSNFNICLQLRLFLILSLLSLFPSQVFYSKDEEPHSVSGRSSSFSRSDPDTRYIPFFFTPILKCISRYNRQLVICKSAHYTDKQLIVLVLVCSRCDEKSGSCVTFFCKLPSIHRLCLKRSRLFGPVVIADAVQICLTQQSGHQKVFRNVDWIVLRV